MTDKVDWQTQGFDAYFDNLNPKSVPHLPPDPVSDWFAYTEWKEGKRIAVMYVNGMRNPHSE